MQVPMSPLRSACTGCGTILISIESTACDLLRSSEIAGPTLSMHPISVLIVDDDPWVTRGLASAFIAVSEVHVRGVAHSGEEALAMYRQEPTDVVLMDINMGSGMTGVEATVAILRHDPSARILILTTISPGPGLARALDAGAIAALNKTASIGTLASSVHAAAGGGSPALLKGLVSDLILNGDIELRDSTISPRITPAEHHVLREICDGRGYSEIAERLGISVATVETHAKRLRQKLNATGLGQLVVRAIEYRFVSK